jgi:hypothetical protein
MALDDALDEPTFGPRRGAEVADRERHGVEPTTVEWIRAVVIVVLVATLAISGIVAFAVAFVIQGCCATPTPAL